MKIAIIGGGASGLMLASLLNQSNHNVTLFEKLDHVGKKLLLTGNGRCNITNANINRNCYNNDFAFNIASSFDVVKYFNSLGLLTKVDNEGRIYPYSNVSNSVLDVLRDNLSNINIHENEEIVEIRKDNKTYHLVSNTNSYEFDIVVLATGGKTYYKETNSYKLVSMLNHTVTSLRPTLTYVKVNENLASIENIRANCKARLICNSKVVYEDKGEVLFKKDYLSGIVMFQLSSYIARNPYSIYKVELDLTPDIDKEELEKYLSKNNNLIGLFPKMLGNYVLKRKGNLVDNIKGLSFDVIDNLDFKNAQVTCGGIKVEEVKETLESKNNEGLYFMGEVIDADGICGGYNLQFAFASSYIVYKDIIGKYEK